MNRRTVLLGLLAFGLSSCSVLNLSHVQTLREAQDRYSALVARENRLALEAVLPGATDDRATEDREDTASLLDPGLVAHDIQDLQRGYQQVQELLETLLQRASAELQEDKLLGSCLTLRVLARWRAVFYLHLLRAQELGEGDNGPVPPSMTAVAALADTTLKQLEAQKIELFPRDRFLLKAMLPLVRYDIAYIRASANVRSPDWEKEDRKAALVKERSGEIVAAELEMVDAAKKETPQIQRYAFLTRLLMLRTGRTLAVLTFEKAARAAALPELQKRILALHADYAATEFLRNAIKLKPADLEILIPPLTK